MSTQQTQIGVFLKPDGRRVIVRSAYGGGDITLYEPVEQARIVTADGHVVGSIDFSFEPTPTAPLANPPAGKPAAQAAKPSPLSISQIVRIAERLQICGNCPGEHYRSHSVATVKCALVTGSSCSCLSLLNGKCPIGQWGAPGSSPGAPPNG